MINYIGRINKAMDYIEENIDKNLSLKEVSQIACFSPFHFHRLFSAYAGETVNAFIQRKRIEKISSLIMQKDDTPLSTLASMYGFNSPSSLSRTFKKYYGVSPTELMKMDVNRFSKIRKVDSKNGKEKIRVEKYICNIDNLKQWLLMRTKVEVKDLPAMDVVYIPHVGSFDQIGEVYEQLFRWAGPKGILSDPNMKTITVYHDNPSVTEMSKLRQSAGIVVNGDVKVDGKVNKLKTGAGRYAVGHFEISVMEFEKAWNSMCVWVEENGFKSRDDDHFELYYNDHTKHPENKFILDICIPVN